MKFAKFIIPALAFAACGNPTPETGNASKTADTGATSVQLTPAQLQNAALEIGKPTVQAIGSALKVNGFIEAPPQNLVSISFPLGGYLKNTRLLPGAHVKRGEVLATLEDPQYITLQQDYLTAKTRLEFLSADLSRQETLNRDKSSSDKALQLSRSDYQTQLITAKALAEKLRLIGLDPDKMTADNISKSVRIYSPIDGFVASVKVNIGKYVSPTDVLFELVNTDDIHLTLKVFEKDLANLRVGQKVIAYANADPAKTFGAKIILISQNVGEDRSVEVHCHFDNAAHGLLPGMFMTAEIEVENKNAVTVPGDALVRYDNRHFVFAAKSDTGFDMLEVEPGVAENGFVQLTGASAQALMQQNIVLKNAYTLLMKMKNAEEE